MRAGHKEAKGRLQRSKKLLSAERPKLAPARIRAVARKLTYHSGPTTPVAKSPRGPKPRDSAGREHAPNPDGVEVLTVANFSRHSSWLVHGFSTRQGGVSSAYGGRALNLGLTREDTPENIARNRERFIGKLGAVDAKGHPWPVITVNQIHSAIIHRVRPEHYPATPG